MAVVGALLTVPYLLGVFEAVLLPPLWIRASYSVCSSLCRKFSFEPATAPTPLTAARFPQTSLWFVIRANYL